MDEKKIMIEGTGNRYLMKKLIQPKGEPKMRKEVVNWNLQSKIYSDEYQLFIINELFESFFSKTTEKKALTQETKIAERQIEKKIQGYKKQDICKNRFLEEEFVTLENVITYLHSSNLSCHYCDIKMYILYEHVRENRQWTLDRLNNDKGHNKDNLVVCCLQCNLKRRRTNEGAFLFTKKLQIVKTSLD